MKRLVRLAGALPIGLFIAASCSASTGADSKGSGGGGGTAGSGGADGGPLCGFCASAKSYVPCDANGQPGQIEECAEACSPDIGCTACQAKTNICEGNAVHKCKDDGSGPGELLETCDVENGQVCNDGACQGACQIAEDQPSNVGCEFWAVDLDQQDGGGNDPASAPWGVVLSNAGAGTANVTIEINEAQPGQPPKTTVVQQVSVPAGGLEAITLPTRELDCGVMPNDYASPGTCLSSRAFRITASAPIIVYQFNVFANAFSNDASLLLPTNALGKIYRVIGWPAGHPVLVPGFNILDRSYVTIVGTVPNTQVKVRPRWKIKGNPPIPPTLAGGEITATIGPFDVLNLETDDATLAEASANEFVSDLSGTVVEASAPVAVFSGVESTSAPGPVDIPTYPGWNDESCCLDHLEEQMFPVESVGKEYIVTRSPVRSTGSYKEPDILRFVGVAEVAQVTTNLPAPYDSFTLQPGEIVTTYAQNDIVVSATTPVMVGQVLVSQGYVQGAVTGDPALTVFPPVEQYRTEYVILTPQSWSKNYVVIAAPQGAQVWLDGTLTSCPTSTAGVSGGVTYESRVCPLTEGVHKLTGDQAFGIVAYGYGSAGSYAFAGGADVKKIYEPPPVR